VICLVGEKLFALFEWKWGLASHVSLHLKCTFHLAIYMSSETRIEHTLSWIHWTPGLYKLHVSAKLIKVALCISSTLTLVFYPYFPPCILNCSSPYYHKVLYNRLLYVCSHLMQDKRYNQCKYVHYFHSDFHALVFLAPLQNLGCI
jgi:hypothetical protein